MLWLRPSTDLYTWLFGLPVSLMWPGRIYVLFMWVLIFMSLVYRPGAGHYRYLADKLLRIRFRLVAPPPALLHLHTDITFFPRRMFIWARAGIFTMITLNQYNPSGALLVIPHGTSTGLLTSVLTSLCRSANTLFSLTAPVSTLRCLTSARLRARVTLSRISLLTVSLTFSV